MSLRLPAVVCLVAWSLCAFASAPQPAPKIRVLFEVGGTTAHEYAKQPALLKQVLEDTGRFTVTISQDRDLFRRESISRFDEVMLYTTRVELNEEQLKGLLEFVEDGGALVGIHSSTAMCMKSDEFWRMIGGRFVKHGAGTFKVKITAKRHSICQGLSDFDETDETYIHSFCPSSKLVVLMRREKDGEPVSWVHYYGRGRVFYTALGHDMRTWGNADFQNLVVRGSLWAAGRINP